MAEQTYNLNGPKQFFFPFPVQQKSQLTLTVQPDGTVVPEADYDVVGAAPDAFAVTVTWLTAPTDGTQTLHVARFTEVARVTDFVDDQAVPARALNAEYNNIYQILGELEDRISDLEDRMEALELRVDDLEDRMAAVELRLDLVEADIVTIFNLLTLLDGRVTSLEARMAAAEGRLDDVEDRLDDVEANLGTSTYQVNGVTQATSVRTVNLVDSNLLPGQFTVTQTGPNSAQVEVRPDVPAVSGTVALHVGALVTNSGGAGTVIPAATPTPVAFSNVAYDDVEIFDGLEPTRLTAPVGTTRVQLSAALQFDSASAAQVEIWKNGAPFHGGIASTESMFTAGSPAGRPGLVSAVVDAVAGDYFEVVVTSALAQLVEPSGQTFFSMTLMQATGLLPAAGGALVSRTTDQVIATPNTPVPVDFNNTVYDDATIVDGDGLRMPITLSADRCRLVGAVQITNAEDIQIYVTKNSDAALTPNFIGAASFKRINHSEVGEDDFYTISSPILEVAPGDIFRVLVRSENNEEITIRGGNATWFGLELVGTPQPGFNGIQTLVAGTGIAIDDTNPQAPEISVTALAITDTFVVASEAAMLALDAQTGDVAVRTDTSTTYILMGTDPTVLGDWVELLSPPDAVTSVNGQVGTVVLTADDVGALESGDNVSELVNDAGYVTAATSPVTSVNTLAGDVVLDYGDFAGAEGIALNNSIFIRARATGGGPIAAVHRLDAGNLSIFGDVNYQTRVDSLAVPQARYGGNTYGLITTQGGQTIAGTTFGLGGVLYSWPGANAVGALTNDGAGNLTWTAVSGFVPLNTAGTEVVNVQADSSGVMSWTNDGANTSISLQHNGSDVLVVDEIGINTAITGGGVLQVLANGDALLGNDEGAVIAFAGTGGVTITAGGGGSAVKIASGPAFDDDRLGFFSVTAIVQPVLTTGTQAELIAALGSTSGLGLVDDSAVVFDTVIDPVPGADDDNKDVFPPANPRRHNTIKFDTTGGAQTAHMETGTWLPGDTVRFIDYASNFSTANLMIDFETHNFEGVAAQTLVMSVDNGSVTLEYIDSTRGFQRVAVV